MVGDDLKYASILPYNKKYNYYMQLESIGRYMFAHDYLKSKGLKTVFDIGCYNGFGCEIMAASADYVYGIDINKRYISLANLNKEKHEVKNVAYDLINIMDDAAAKDKKFDLITCFDTIAHVEDDKALIKKLYNLLSDDGYLIASVPYERFEPLKPDGTSACIGHLHFYEPNQIKKMFINENFEVVERLGQGISNIFLNLESFLIRSYEYPERKVKSFYTFEKESMHYFARLVAYPTIRNIDDSYSIILVLRKKK